MQEENNKNSLQELLDVQGAYKKWKKGYAADDELKKIGEPSFKSLQKAKEHCKSWSACNIANSVKEKHTAQDDLNTWKKTNIGTWGLKLEKTEGKAREEEKSSKYLKKLKLTAGALGELTKNYNAKLTLYQNNLKNFVNAKTELGKINKAIAEKCEAAITETKIQAQERRWPIKNKALQWVIGILSCGLVPLGIWAKREVGLWNEVRKIQSVKDAMTNDTNKAMKEINKQAIEFAKDFVNGTSKERGEIQKMAKSLKHAYKDAARYNAGLRGKHDEGARTQYDAIKSYCEKIAEVAGKKGGFSKPLPGIRGNSFTVLASSAKEEAESILTYNGAVNEKITGSRVTDAQKKVLEGINDMISDVINGEAKNGTPSLDADKSKALADKLKEANTVKK